MIRINKEQIIENNYLQQKQFTSQRKNNITKIFR